MTSAVYQGKKKIRVGSRESELAQAQARHIMALLTARFPELDCTLTTFKTTGDLNQTNRLSEFGEKGLFTKELEVALLENQIDLAVHSLKDMPGKIPEGLALISAGTREDPRDVLISKNHMALEQFPAGSVIGTSSTRRVAMLKRCRPDVVCENIRGNLQTRLRKLDEGQYDAILLAAAGVHRLGWQERVTQYLDPENDFVPAPGQGILGVEYRALDKALEETLGAIQDPATQAAMLAERSVLIEMEAGCHTPLGVHAKLVKPESLVGDIAGEEERLMLTVILLSPEGQQAIRQQAFVSLAAIEPQAKELAQCVLKDGLKSALN